MLLFVLIEDDEEMEAEMPSTTSAEMCPVAVACALALMNEKVIIKIAAAVVKINFFIAFPGLIFILMTQRYSALKGPKTVGFLISCFV